MHFRYFNGDAHSTEGSTQCHHPASGCVYLFRLALAVVLKSDTTYDAHAEVCVAYLSARLALFLQSPDHIFRPLDVRGAYMSH